MVFTHILHCAYLKLLRWSASGLFFSAAVAVFDEIDVRDLFLLGVKAGLLWNMHQKSKNLSHIEAGGKLELVRDRQLWQEKSGVLWLANYGERCWGGVHSSDTIGISWGAVFLNINFCLEESNVKIIIQRRFAWLQSNWQQRDNPISNKPVLAKYFYHESHFHAVCTKILVSAFDSAPTRSWQSTFFNNKWNIPVQWLGHLRRNRKALHPFHWRHPWR